MFSDAFSRRAFAGRITAYLAGLSMAGTVIAAAAGAEEAPTPTDDGISRTEEAIHQEVAFRANRHRVYEVLTNAKQFDRVVRLSAAMRGGMPRVHLPRQ